MCAALAPRLVFRLEKAVPTGCIEVEIRDGRILLARPCHYDNGREVTSFKTMLTVATLKAK